MTIFGTRSKRTIQPLRTFDYNKKHHHWLHTLINGGSLSGSKKCFNTSMPINKISIDFIRKHSDVKTTRLKGKTKDLFSVFQLFKVFLALQNHGLIHFKFVTKPLIDLSPQDLWKNALTINTKRSVSWPISRNLITEKLQPDLFLWKIQCPISFSIREVLHTSKKKKHIYVKCNFMVWIGTSQVNSRDNICLLSKAGSCNL